MRKLFVLFLLLIFIPLHQIEALELFGAGGTIIPHPGLRIKNPAYEAYPDKYSLGEALSLPVGLFGLLRPQSNPFLFLSDKTTFIENFDFLTFYNQVSHLQLFLINPEQSVGQVVFEAGKEGISITDGEGNPLLLREIAGSGGTSIGGTSIIPPALISFPLSVGPFYFRTAFFAGTGGFKLVPDERLSGAVKDKTVTADTEYSISMEGSISSGFSQSITAAPELRGKQNSRIYPAVRIIGYYIGGYFEEKLEIKAITNAYGIPTRYSYRRNEFYRYPGNGIGGGLRVDTGIVMDVNSLVLSFSVLNIYGFTVMHGTEKEYKAGEDSVPVPKVKKSFDHFPEPWIGLAYTVHFRKSDLIFAADFGHTVAVAVHAGTLWEYISGQEIYPMKLSKFLLGFFIGFFIFSCSGSTEYVFRLNAQSFLPEDFISKELPVPEGIPITLYIMPGVLIDWDQTGPQGKEKRGLHLDVPTPSPPDPVKLSFEMKGEILISNLEDELTLHEVSLDLFIAPKDAENIYDEGEKVFSLLSEEIEPKEDRILIIESLIEPGSLNHELIKYGDFRLGIRLRLLHEELQLVQTRYTFQTLFIRVSGYPFGLL